MSDPLSPFGPMADGPKSKDGWDKADIVAKFVSSVVIAGVGVLITWSMQTSQIETNRAIANAQLEASRLKAADEKHLQEGQITVQLVNHLISKDPVQRQVAVIALRRSVPNPTYEAIVEVLAKTDPNESVRVAAISHLGASTSAKVTETLSSIVADPQRSRNERALAARATEQVSVRAGLDRGTYVFGAASLGEAAYEDAKLGGGIFTHFLIRGLGGEADLNGDGVTSAAELRGYLDERVSAYTRVISSRPQRPVFSMFGASADTPILGEVQLKGDVTAIVIGISKYRTLPHLAFSVSDAKAFANVIRKSGAANIQLLTDATQAQVLAALDRGASSTSKDSTLIVYYSGRAILDSASGTTAWMASDSDPGLTLRTSVSMDEVKRLFSRSHAKAKFLFIDSCDAGGAL